MSRSKSVVKDIKVEIFSNECDYDIIYNYLITDFDEAVSAILNSLLKLFRKIDNISNREMSDNLITLLGNYSSKNKNKNTLNKLYERIDLFLGNLSKSLSRKELMDIEGYISGLVDVQNRCLISNSLKGKGDKYNFIMYLVFKNRDIELFGKYLMNNMQELIISNSILPSVFMSIIEKYISIEEDSIYEINYFNQVIYLFMRGKLGDKLLSNSDYVNILKTSDKSFVWDLIYRIENDFVMSREELASIYGMSFYYPSIKEKFDYCENSVKDFTSQEVLTIDNDGDTCLDDGLFIKKNSDGTYRLYIHLANIPEVIPYSSLTMREALRRQKTIYLPDDNIPIFEDYLSSGVLSLLPNKKTNTLTFILDVDTDYSLLLDTLRVVPGVIISKHKLTYDSCDELLKNGDTVLSENLNLLSEICNRLSKDNLRVKSFHKFKNILSNRTDTNSFKADTSPAHLIVEQSMVLSGRLIPMLNKYLNLNMILPWRVHPKFDEKFVKRFLDDIDNVNEMNSSLKRIAMDYFSKSYYSFDNIGHAGLGFDGYVRVGSAARRAMDALAQYIVYDFIINRYDGNLDYKYYFWESEIKYWCEYANNRIALNNSFAEEYAYLKRNGKILEKK